MKTISMLALFATVVSALFLYFGSQPILGAVQFVGGGKTEQEIKSSERKRSLQIYIGFALLVVSAAAQIVVLYRTK